MLYSLLKKNDLLHPLVFIEFKIFYFFKTCKKLYTTLQVIHICY